MNETTKITLVKNLDVTDLSGEKVMVDFETGKYFLLKGVANDIWEYIQKPTTVKQIKEQLLCEYEVDEKTCLNEIIKFLTELKSNEFIQLN
ncbi:MAG: PqqD family peptide modification chaperone [bacterium]|nr:PqqD family peptide modification chaperone [bacterium]